MASWRKIPGEDEELAFGLLQGSEGLKGCPVDAKLKAVKIARRLRKNRDDAGTGPVKGDAARSSRTIPNWNIFLTENLAPAFVFYRIKCSRVTPANVLECS